jgi:tryptophanyl-tRNA synthetase
MDKESILSGMRPTGTLHLGNYFGALVNWVRLQNHGSYECYYMIADWHALTTDYEDTRQLKNNIFEVAKCFLAAGLEPEKSTIFVQSWVKEHCELALLLSMIVPLSWLERNPTYKEQLRELKGRELHTHGFLGYPVLQAADIILYKASYVPVGEDQLPHIELTREIVRRFNYIYKTNIFKEPQPLLTPQQKVLGLDGRKMSKSYNNCIYLSDTKDKLKEKISSMFTDPQKIHIDDKGHPEGCVVFSFYQLLAKEKSTLREKECKEGKIGCVACKNELVVIFDNFLSPIREKYYSLEQKKDYLYDILKEGSKKAKNKAEQTMEEVREAIWGES